MPLIVQKQWTSDVSLRILFGMGRFGWCSDGYHGDCRKHYTPRFSDTVRYCQCDDPDCQCRLNPREATADAELAAT